MFFITALLIHICMLILAPKLVYITLHYIQDVTFVHNFYVITKIHDRPSSPAVDTIRPLIYLLPCQTHTTPAPPIAHARAVSQLSIKLSPCRTLISNNARQALSLLGYLGELGLFLAVFQLWLHCESIYYNFFLTGSWNLFHQVVESVVPRVTFDLAVRRRLQLNRQSDRVQIYYNREGLPLGSF